MYFLYVGLNQVIQEDCPQTIKLINGQHKNSQLRGDTIRDEPDAIGGSPLSLIMCVFSTVLSPGPQYIKSTGPAVTETESVWGSFHTQGWGK